MKKLLDHIERFANVRLAVVGDVMLDGYIWGKATRISPEAPVPVLEVSNVNCCLGGAANVMRNVATLTGNALAYGVIGNDPDGKMVLDQLNSYGIPGDTLEIDGARRTTHKQRVIAGNQQLLRIDYEEITQVDNSIRRKITDDILSLIEKDRIDGVIFEDYGKGLLAEWMLEEIISAAEKHHIITVLDPKPGNLAPVKGLTLMKPNRPEAMQLANIKERFGENRLEDAAKIILEEWQMEYLLISLSNEGMALFNQNGQGKLIPTRAIEVFDVSGAGDTAVATCALALAAKVPVEEAVELANFAAGIVVGKVGTAVISAEDLAKTIKRETC